MITHVLSKFGFVVEKVSSAVNTSKKPCGSVVAETDSFRRPPCGGDEHG